jgi:thiol-disulfide isomerase/thioredoxin
MRTRLPTALLLLVLLSPVKAEESRTVTGRVIDVKGSAIADAAIDFFWSANGPVADEHGQPIDLTTDEARKQYWTRFGQMEPFLKAKSEADGRFSIKARGNFHTLMAMDAQRIHGGLAMIPKDYDGSEIEIRLQPLVRVTGNVEGPQPGVRPAQAMVVAEVPEDPTRPLHMCRLVLGEAREGRIAMSLPPGRYILDAYDGEFTGRLAKEITLPGDKTEVDLGIITLAPARPNINDKVKQSQASGAMGDYKKRYGEKLPAWHIVDARGVSKNVQLSDFKGKWVLLDFWALNCHACLKHDLPHLAKFYDDHKNQRNQFEILAICIDCNGEMNTVAEVDRALEPIVKHVWSGKPLPFPLLLDPSMTTLERFGVPGYETILIDPDGRLVEGGETTLAEKLKEKRP